MSDTRRQIAERHAYGETALMKTRSASILESAMSEYAAAVLEECAKEIKGGSESSENSGKSEIAIGLSVRSEEAPCGNASRTGDVMTDPKSQSAVQREQVEKEIAEDSEMRTKRSLVERQVKAEFGGHLIPEVVVVDLRLRLREVEQERNAEIGKWQEQIYKLCCAIAVECGVPDFKIDGGGSDGDDLLFTLTEISQAFQILRESAESRLAQAGKLAEAARAMTECQGLWWRDGDCTPRCHCCDAAEKEPHFPDCHAGALRTALSDFDKL